METLHRPRPGRDARFHPITQNGVQLKTYELLFLEFFI